MSKKGGFADHFPSALICLRRTSNLRVQQSGSM